MKLITAIVAPATIHADSRKPFVELPFQNLFETMIYVCELLTDEPEGGSAMIPLPIFLQLYEYLGKLDCSGKCPCVIEEGAEGPLHPVLPPASEETSSLSGSYSVPSATVKEVATIFIESIKCRSIRPTMYNHKCV